jgi:AraC family transcriptional activator of pobA
MFPLDIHKIEESDDHWPGQYNIPCLPEGFEIIWITRGGACLMVDEQECVLDNERLCLLAPGTNRQLAIKGPAEGYLISFSSESLYPEGTPNEPFWLDVWIDDFSLFVFRGQQGDLDEMEDLLLKIKKEFEREEQTRGDVLKGLLKVFMAYFSHSYYLGIPKAGSRRDKCIARKYLSLVKNNFRTKKAVSDYAGELCISPNYLNQVVKRVSGFTATYHIQQSIVRDAKKQALYSNLSMKEIADYLGFTDCAHFSKFFKNASGMSFSSFKNARDG